MKLYIGLAIVLLGTVACDSSNAPTKVALTGSELTEAQAIAVERQRLALDQQKAAVAYQAAQDHFNEANAELNIRSTELCFQLKKSHKLDPGAQYQLNEWRGELVKIGGN